MKGLSPDQTCTDCIYSCMQGLLTDEDFQLIDANKTETKYEAGEIILKQGTFISQVIYLKSGMAKVILEGKNDRNTIIKTVTSKNFIALPILGNSNVYPFSVISITKSTICHIRKDTMLEIFNRNKKLREYIINWFSKDYLFLYNKIAVLSTRNNHGKLASALLYLANNEEDNLITEIISRKDLAELASISLESTNKILMELKHDKIIDIENKSIKILRPDLMKRLSTIG